METIIIIVAVVVCVTYSCIIISFLIGIKNLKGEVFSKNQLPEIKFSIIIPFRNEAVNLPELLLGLIGLDYNRNLYELIFIDDESEDQSVALIENYLSKEEDINYSILKNTRKSNSPKKDAIASAITKANFEWILTTDADCYVPATWLKSFNSIILKANPVMVIGPVTYKLEKGFINAFETLDFLSLTGSTMGGCGIGKPFLCNGANLAYQKKVFLEVNGFSGNDSIAGGDDIFMLEKLQNKFPEKIVFLKQQEAIVVTKPAGSFKKLWSQRLRWASKTAAYANRFALLIGLTVFAMNTFLILLFVFYVFNVVEFTILSAMYLVKFNLDFLLLFQAAKFYQQEHVLKAYFFSSIIYPVFNFLIALRSFFGGYDWKGRHFKK